MINYFKSLNALNFILVFLVTSFATMFYLYSQPQNTEFNGLGSDGRDYYKMYQYYSGKSSDELIRYPFCKRPGTPFLASLLPFSAKNAFLAVNLISGFLAIIFTFFALSKVSNILIKWACILPLIFYQFSPIRFPNFYPYIVDPPAICLYALSVYFLTRENYWWSIAALVISCFFKEQGVYFAVMIGLVFLILKKKKTSLCIGMILFSLGGIVLNYYSRFPSHRDGSQLATILEFFNKRFSNGGDGFISGLNGIALTLAPFILTLRINALGRLWSLLKSDSILMIITSWFLMALAMGLFGGADTNRIFFVSYPLFVLFLANLMEEQKTFKIGLFSLAGLIANDFLGFIYENPHQNLIPRLFDSLSGQFVPLPVSNLFFWLFIYGVWAALKKFKISLS